MSFPYKILFKESTSWKELASYNTKEAAISYIENVIPTMRPIRIVFAQDEIRSYDYGMIDYEELRNLKEENEELRNGLWEVRRK